MMRKIIQTALLFGMLLAGTAVWAAPSITGLTASSATVGRYDVLSMDFQVQTVASNPYWPYDANPPVSIEHGAGVTVEGLFSNDNWATSVTMPGFYYQPFEIKLIGGGGTYSDEAVTPTGYPRWRVRFAPARLGQWRYKIRVTDSSGTSVYPESGDMGFECVASDNRGFVRVSPTDPRYFETSDGQTVEGLGLNLNFTNTYAASDLLQLCGNNGVKVVRWWMTFRGYQNPFGGGVAGTPGPQWEYSLQMSNAGGHKLGDRYSGVLSSGGRAAQTVYLPPGLTFRFSGYVKTVGVTGTSGTGAVPFIGTTVSSAISGTQDWTRFEALVSSGNGGKVEIGIRHTGSGGQVYFDDLNLEAMQDGTSWIGPYMSKGDFEYQNYVDLREAWKVDRIFETAKADGVYLKTVLSEKQDYTLGCIDASGNTISASDGNFYASADHPSRWLQKAWWRYCTARWGCFTSLHSWELCNEGDPFSGLHYNAGNAFADTIHAADPYGHLATTSFWHSIPMEFWKTSTCDFINLHEFFGPATSQRSHGPRFYAWYDPSTSTSSALALLPVENSTGSVSLDPVQRHSGTASAKIIAKAGGNGWGWGQVSACPSYHVGVDPTHTYTFRFWAKADDVGVLGPSLGWTRPGLHVTWSKAYAENDFVSQQNISAPLGTYDWQQTTVTGVRPPANANTLNASIVSTCWPDHDSMFWVDDLEIIDETTGKNLYVDGGFEGDRIDYDTALAIKKYGVLADSYGRRIAKPVIMGETGIRGTKDFGDSYKGYGYTEENQQLVDDLAGVHLRKMIWAHIGPENPNMMYYWSDNVVKKGLWRLFGAFDLFMRDAPVSNGSYQDAKAVCSVSGMRAWGQKDLTHNRAHLWIDNTSSTWKNVVDAKPWTSLSGTVSVSGLLRDGTYTLEFWDTTNGGIISTSSIECASGIVTIPVAALQTDVACKVFPFVPVDHTPPVVQISVPAGISHYWSVDSPLTVGGVASDNVAVTQVKWSNNRGGEGTCSGTNTWSAGGIVLAAGSNVITITATDAAGNIGSSSLEVSYFGPPQVPGRIGEAKLLPSGTGILLQDKVVTGVIAGRKMLFIEEVDRSAGLRVSTQQCAGDLMEGQSATFRGVLIHSSETGTELYLTGVTPGALGTPLPPLFMKTLGIGGLGFGGFAPGVTGGVGLNSLGLLVRVIGRVTWCDAGAKLARIAIDAAGTTGTLLIDISGSGITPSTGSFVSVTGDLDSTPDAGELVPVIRTRRASDMQVLVGP